MLQKWMPAEFVQAGALAGVKFECLLSKVEPLPAETKSTRKVDFLKPNVFGWLKRLAPSCQFVRHSADGPHLKINMICTLHQECFDFFKSVCIKLIVCYDCYPFTAHIDYSELLHNHGVLVSWLLVSLYYMILVSNSFTIYECLKNVIYKDGGFQNRKVIWNQNQFIQKQTKVMNWNSQGISRLMFRGDFGGTELIYEVFCALFRTVL